MIGSLGSDVVDIVERITFLEGGTKHQVKPKSLDPFQEGDHLSSC